MFGYYTYEEYCQHNQIKTRYTHNYQLKHRYNVNGINDNQASVSTTTATTIAKTGTTTTKTANGDLGTYMSLSF